VTENTGLSSVSPLPKHNAMKAYKVHGGRFIYSRPQQ